MRQLSFLLCFALISLMSCSEEGPVSDLGGAAPSVQANGQYDPFSEQSVILNSHSIYGVAVLNNGGNGNGLAGHKVVWDGPWEDNQHPIPEMIQGECMGENTVCYVVVTASAAKAIFQAEGEGWNNHNDPAVLIRAYMNYSDMVLVDNFQDNSSNGMHTGQIIKVL